MMNDKTESLQDQYDKEPLIVNEYTDECHVVDYYDVNKWISENKELVKAMLAEGENSFRPYKYVTDEERQAMKDACTANGVYDEALYLNDIAKLNRTRAKQKRGEL